MRPRYGTPALVLGRHMLGEASARIALLTPEFGLVRARAQGIRKPGAKLASALATLSESEVILVKGKEGWRLSGAVLAFAHHPLLSSSQRARAGRIASLATKLMHAESHDEAPYEIVRGFMRTLSILSEEEGETAECLAALRLLASLGFDAGEIPGKDDEYGSAALATVAQDRSAYIQRINRGIAASGV
ncbi:MAG: recombination protein O N-terminal domain-containing protein [Minisyncoccia bacterium]